jgi:hypothetical protein
MRDGCREGRRDLRLFFSMDIISLTVWDQKGDVNITAQLIMRIGNHCDTSVVRDR